MNRMARTAKLTFYVVRFSGGGGLFLSIATLVSQLGGCAGSSTVVPISPTPPAIPLSDEVIHSPNDDMTARIPAGWVIMDAGALGSHDAFAVMCDPRYTIAVVFSELKIDELSRGISRDAPLEALVAPSLLRRKKNLGARAEMLGAPELFDLGEHSFVRYAYTSDSARSITNVAIFRSSGRIYECAITPLEFGTTARPDSGYLREVQRTVLESLDY